MYSDTRNLSFLFDLNHFAVPENYAKMFAFATVRVVGEICVVRTTPEATMIPTAVENYAVWSFVVNVRPDHFLALSINSFTGPVGNAKSQLHKFGIESDIHFPLFDELLLRRRRAIVRGGILFDATFRRGTAGQEDSCNESEYQRDLFHG